MKDAIDYRTFEAIPALQPVPRTVEQVALQAAANALALPGTEEVKLLVTRYGGRRMVKLLVEEREPPKGAA